jgi:hypothetical protein
MAKLFTIEAAVHQGANVAEGFRVKVSVIDLGIYINGMVVYPPNERSDEWTVYTPAKRAGRGKYVHIVEFNKKLPLWNEINEACIEAAKLESQMVKDVVITDIDDEPIDWNSIPFK